MDLKIINKQDNPLLSRMEIKGGISFFNEATPKKEDIKKKISTVEKVDEKVVVVKNVSGNFGPGECNFLVYIYKSEEELKKVEPKKKEKKAGAAPAEGAKGAPKEKAKEAPKGEKKEAKEAPKEEKPKEEKKG